MRSVRIIIAVLIALGLTLSPVAAGMLQAKMVKCDHERTMQHDQMVDHEQDMKSGQADCLCCQDAAACPPSSCAAKCFDSVIGLVDTSIFVQPIAERLHDFSAVAVTSLGYPPEPPPPRA